MEIVNALPAGTRPAEIGDLFLEDMEGDARLKLEKIFYRRRGAAWSKHATGAHTNIHLLLSDIKLGWIYV